MSIHISEIIFLLLIYFTYLLIISSLHSLTCIHLKLFGDDFASPEQCSRPGRLPSSLPSPGSGGLCHPHTCQAAREQGKQAAVHFVDGMDTSYIFAGNLWSWFKFFTHIFGDKRLTTTSFYTWIYVLYIYLKLF